MPSLRFAPYREIASEIAARLAAARGGCDPLAPWDEEVIVPSRGAAEGIAGELLKRLPRGIAGLQLQSLDELVEFFIAAGKKGVAVNRYKGLGEMNPDQLWATTMDPEIRTLLQVRAEDHTEADLMFTTLMGDQVEPRRKFIEDNATKVANLDV